MWSKRRHRWAFVVLSAAVGSTLFFQNCTNKGFQGADYTSSFSSSSGVKIEPHGTSTPAQLPLPPGCSSSADCQRQEAEANTIFAKTAPVKNANCFADGSVNACLFFKNPVASRGAFFTTTVNNSMDLRPYQTMGIKMDPATYEAGTGCLKNPSYRVYTNVTMPTTSTIRGDDACFPNLDFKVPYFNDTSFRVSAVMAHHYLNFQMNYMKEWTGDWYGTNKGTQVFSYINATQFDNNAAFLGNSSTGTGAIVMGGFERNMTPATALQESALSAEVYLHEAGHGNIFYASNPIRDPKKNITCNTSSTCCSSLNGCFGAINEGQADYHALILFPKNPAIGEAIVNNSNGLVEFGMARNYSLLRDLTPKQAYEAPTNNALDGEIHGTGRIWGSIWFEARQDAERKLGIRGVRAVDRLFTAHLAALTGDDDFQTACQKTVTLARTVDSGIVKDIFAAECTRRGF